MSAHLVGISHATRLSPGATALHCDSLKGSSSSTLVLDISVMAKEIEFATRWSTGGLRSIGACDYGVRTCNASVNCDNRFRFMRDLAEYDVLAFRRVALEWEVKQSDM